jgi:hypothetical protein
VAKGNIKQAERNAILLDQTLAKETPQEKMVAKGTMTSLENIFGETKAGPSKYYELKIA